MAGGVLPWVVDQPVVTGPAGVGRGASWGVTGGLGPSLMAKEPEVPVLKGVCSPDSGREAARIDNGRGEFLPEGGLDVMVDETPESRMGVRRGGMG